MFCHMSINVWAGLFPISREDTKRNVLFIPPRSENATYCKRFLPSYVKHGLNSPRARCATLHMLLLSIYQVELFHTRENIELKYRELTRSLEETRSGQQQSTEHSVPTKPCRVLSILSLFLMPRTILRLKQHTFPKRHMRAQLKRQFTAAHNDGTCLHPNN